MENALCLHYTLRIWKEAEVLMQALAVGVQAALAAGQAYITPIMLRKEQIFSI
jgi:hypothetical protein